MSMSKAQGKDLVTLDDLRMVRTSVKCMMCGLHFNVYSDLEDKKTRHNINTLYCPECGQHEGSFLVWKEEVNDFIFNHVPGSAKFYEAKL